MTVKDRLIEFLKYLDISQAKFEKSIEMSNGWVNNLKDSIRNETQKKISSVYPDFNIVWLIAGEGQMLKSSIERKETTIPIYELGATAGNVEIYQDMAQKQPSGRLNIPGFEDCNFAMPVWGESMYPTYENGSYVICRWIIDASNINWGENYYIEWADYRMIKRLVKGDNENEVYLCSDNENEMIAGRQKYAPIVVKKDEIRKMALIKGVYKRSHH